MMKRTSLTKSGSTVTSSTAAISAGQGGSTFVPPYQPLSPIGKQNSHEANSIYNILQDSKRNNNIVNNGSKNTRSNQSTSILNMKQNYAGTQATNIYSQPLSSQHSSQLGSNLGQQQQHLQSSYSANQLNTPSQQNPINSAVSVLSSTSKPSESLLQQNQRLLMSAQKTASLHSNSTSLLNNYVSNTQGNSTSTSKSPLSHTSTTSNNYRIQTQYTPTSQKQSSSIHQGTPKILLTGGGISGTKSASMFHSHRPSLAAGQSANENISSQKQRHASKNDVVKKYINQNNEQSTHPVTHNNNFIGVQQSIQGLNPSGITFLSSNTATGSSNYAASILKESNGMKNTHNSIINSIMQQQQQQQSQNANVDKENNQQNNILDFQQKGSNNIYAKNLRIGSCSNLDSSHLSNNLLNTSNNLLNVTSTTGINQNLSGISVAANNNNNNNNTSVISQNNPLKNSNVHFDTSNYYSNQLSTDRSIPRTPKSPKTLSTTNLTTNENVNGSIQSKSNLQFLYNTTQTQNTDVDGQHNTDTTQMMNISQISATTNPNVSTNSVLDRSAITSQSDMILTNATNGGNIKSTTENNESTSKDVSYHKCSNHPDKKAKYIICNSQNSNNIYCSKCAIQFSKDGFQPIHIQEFNSQMQQMQSISDQQTLQQQQQQQQQQQLQFQQSNQQNLVQGNSLEVQEKLREIVSFLENINSQGEKWQELSHALMIKKKDVSNFYEKQYAKVEQQYGGLIEMINKLKEQAVQNLNVNRERSVQIYKFQEKEIEQNLTDYVSIKADIEMNTEKIVKQIQMEDFSRIMSSYKEKLYKMTDFFSKIGSEFIDLAKFKAPAPAQFFPTFDQAFEIGSFSTTLVKKRVSEFMSIKKSQQQQMILQNSSLQQSSQSNFNKDSLFSPNIKSARISGSMIENGSISSARNSLSGSQYGFFNFTPGNNNSSNTNITNTLPNPEFGRMKNDQMMIIHEIQEDELAERLGTQNTQYNQSNQQSACNSPVRNSTNNQQNNDLLKKDIYVSFGNNKEASLHKAIQQVKNNHLNQQNQNQNQNNNQNSYVVYMDQLQTTPVQNTGVYIHQIKPLTDIIEHSNMNEEEEKSQPNTPELMKVEENPIKHTPSSAYYTNNNGMTTEQQKPFRNLFGGAQDEVLLQPESINNNYHSTPSSMLQASNSKNGQIISENHQMVDVLNNANGNSLIKSPSQLNFSSSKLPHHLSQNASMSNLNGSVNNINNSLSTTAYKYGASAQPSSTKSPRYSMVEHDENNGDNSHPLTFPISKNNNQLDDYVQMIERQNVLSHFNGNNMNNNNNQNEDNKSSFISQDEKQPVNTQMNQANSSLFNDNSYNYLSKNYFSQPHTTATPTSSSRISMQQYISQQQQDQSQQQQQQVKEQQLPLSMNLIAPQDKKESQQDDDEVIVTHDKQEDLDNPLFSSPGYKQ